VSPNVLFDNPFLISVGHFVGRALIPISTLKVTPFCSVGCPHHPTGSAPTTAPYPDADILEVSSTTP
jgi:hypothetical protein